jgi:hypothetical protein
MLGRGEGVLLGMLEFISIVLPCVRNTSALLGDPSPGRRRSLSLIALGAGASHPQLCRWWYHGSVGHSTSTGYDANVSRVLPHPALVIA